MANRNNQDQTEQTKEKEIATIRAEDMPIDESWEIAEEDRAVEEFKKYRINGQIKGTEIINGAARKVPITRDRDDIAFEVSAGRWSAEINSRKLSPGMKKYLKFFGIDKAVKGVFDTFTSERTGQPFNAVRFDLDGTLLYYFPDATDYKIWVKTGWVREVI